MNIELNTTPALLKDEHINGAHDNEYHHDCPLCLQDPELVPIRKMALSSSVASC